MQKLLTNFFQKSSNSESQKGVLGINNEKVEEVELNGKKVRIPKEHASASVEEQENCPFMKMQKQKELDNQIVDTEAVMPFQKKEKMPKGGCPFMPSENKKNPPLQLDISQKHDMQYISPKNYLLTCKGFSLFPNRRPQKDRKIFDSYPIYLKHTMFHQDEELMVKARKSEISQKFFIFDQFREKGNKFLKKNDLEMALNCYEHALSVIRWIELLDEEDIEYEKELKTQQIQNVKQREEEEEKRKQEEKKKNLIKKTKKGAKIQSINSKQKQRERDEEIQKEIEEMEEMSDYEEVKPMENEEEQKKRQAEQEEAQKKLYEKAKQQILKSSVPNQQTSSNNSNEDTKEDDLAQNTVSDCDSLDRGVRSDDDFDLSEEENDEQIAQNEKNEELEIEEEQKEDFLEKKEREEKNRKHKERAEHLRNKEYLKKNQNEQNLDEDFEDNRSDIAIGDEEDLRERKAELDRETRDEEKKKEKIQQLIKEYELEDNQDENGDDDFDYEESKQEKTKIQMDKKEYSEADLEKLRRQREQKAKEMLELEEEDKEFKKKYKLFLSDFNDENTRLQDGENLKDAHDIDMRQGMLLTVLTNVAIVYLRLGHFTNAIEALEDADKIAQMKSSQIYFRKVQAYCFNKSASLQELIKAKEEIILALKIKSTEKIFKQEKGILKILNLQDHEEAYQSLAIEITDRIHKKREENTEKIQNLLERAAEIEEIYQEMIQDGRKKEGQMDDEEEDMRFSLDKEGKKFEGKELKIFEKIKELEDNKEKEITRLIVEKHYSMVDFYMEQMKIEKVRGAQEELQRVLEIKHEMDFYYNLDLSPDTKDEIVIQINKETKVEFGLSRVQKRLEKLKKEYAKDIYEQGNFNYYIMEFAIKEYFKRVYNLKNRLEQLQDERLKNKKKQKRVNRDNEKPFFSNPLSLQNLFSPQGVLQIAMLLFILLLIFSLYSSDFAKNFNLDQILKTTFRGFSFK